jgi:hypothetical protein
MKQLRFFITDKEEKNRSKFLKEHIKCRDSAFEEEAAPMFSTYTITQTSIANMIKIKCSICGRELDITDYDSI